MSRIVFRKVWISLDMNLSPLDSSLVCACVRVLFPKLRYKSPERVSCSRLCNRFLLWLCRFLCFLFLLIVILCLSKRVLGMYEWCMLLG